MEKKRLKTAETRDSGFYLTPLNLSLHKLRSATSLLPTQNLAIFSDDLAGEGVAANGGATPLSGGEPP